MNTQTSSCPKLADIKSELARRKRDPGLKGSSSDTWRPLTYDTLDHTQRQIRLLRIVSNSPDENGQRFIDCTLTTVSLDDGVGYDALSYAWGDPDPDRCLPIRVNRGWCLISASLWLALKTCHGQQWTKEYLWVDRLSINQNDLQKRSEQVSMMVDIFRQARIAHTWLSDDTGLFSDVRLKGPHPLEILQTAKSSAKVANIETMSEEALEALDDLMSRGWWSRLWAKLSSTDR